MARSGEFASPPFINAKGGEDDSSRWLQRSAHTGLAPLKWHPGIPLHEKWQCPALVRRRCSHRPPPGLFCSHAVSHASEGQRDPQEARPGAGGPPGERPRLLHLHPGWRSGATRARTRSFTEGSSSTAHPVVSPHMQGSIWQVVCNPTYPPPSCHWCTNVNIIRRPGWGGPNRVRTPDLRHQVLAPRTDPRLAPSLVAKAPAPCPANQG